MTVYSPPCPSCESCQNCEANGTWPIAQLVWDWGHYNNNDMEESKTEDVDASPVVVEQEYAATSAQLWSAITDRDEMQHWYFEEIETFEPVVGFKTQFNIVLPEREFLHQWEVTEVIPGERIAYTWQYEQYDGLATVTFDVAPLDPDNPTAGSKLTLTCAGVETFTADIPEFERASCEDGWDYFLTESLKDYLDG